ncbi:MAG TPA: hypothetical protein VFP44_20410, partial [Usitatibacter sp.]|nr:hypothetical protein [Usitatibacter sp.]
RGRKRYDIIVSEPSNPWVSGVASLFTEEFYRRAALYLNDGGVMSQWLHLYEIDTETVASIIGAFQKTFPQFVAYMPNDGDIVLIARKNGAPGAVDPAVLALPGLQPILKKTRLTDLEALRRHAVASSNTLKPMLATYRAPANSDFFPLVDYRTSKTRFTGARASELGELLAAGLPMVEMLDGEFVPTSTPRPLSSATPGSVAAMNGWTVLGGITGRSEVRRRVNGERTEEDAGRTFRLWGSACSPDWTFDDVLPLMVRVAEVVNTQLDSRSSRPIWDDMVGSRCARALPPAEHRWLELFQAVAARDADRMATLGEALVSNVSTAGPQTEYAFLAAVTGMLCRGESQRAREFMDKSIKALRRGQRATQLRYLDAIATDPAASAAAARCR